MTATMTRGNKTATITLKNGVYRAVITLVSDISEYGDVLIARTFITFGAAILFSKKELA